MEITCSKILRKHFTKRIVSSIKMACELLKLPFLYSTIGSHLFYGSELG